MASLNGKSDNSGHGSSLPAPGSTVPKVVLDTPNGKRLREPLGGISAPVPNPGNLLRALRRRWLLALSLGSIVALVSATAVWRFLPPAPQSAYAKLHMPAKVDNILFHHPEANI